MHIRFLCGLDKDYFDYSQVDNNELYDNLDEINKDQEEKFFDEEEPEIYKQTSVYTGEQDY
jgi:hypothetical protein